MRLKDGSLGHLTYCTNIHLGESWTDLEPQLRRHLPAVKAQVAPDAPFGVGLRLSALATEELSRPDRLAAFRDWLAAEDLYVFTLNGFPYGTFHGTPVKRTVYRPDWRQPERLDYSGRLAAVLAELLPEGGEGSVSTVPGAWKGDATAADDAERVADGLIRHAADLHRLRGTTGRTIVLALEPEPGCLLETMDETVSFFQRHLHSDAAARRLGALTGLTSEAAADALRRHLGVCLDCCHAAVEFEDPVAAADRLIEAGIRIGKLQLSVSAALRVERADAAALRALAAFDDPVYLHQAVIRHGDGRLERFDDLPDALARYGQGADGTEWRVHFHVPVFLDDLGAFRTTAPDLARLLARQRRAPLTAHLEVETYSFGVLPPALQRDSVVDSLVRELNWVRAELWA
jgi:sugar phosphate isomerase/epimerase